MNDKVIGVTARLMIAMLFLLSAVGKLTAPAVAMRYTKARYTKARYF
jgi:hypothetical protein